MQKINLIAQSVLELSHCENADDNDNDDNDNDNDDDTHPGWIIVRDRKYSVADKNAQNFFLAKFYLCPSMHKDASLAAGSCFPKSRMVGRTEIPPSVL